MHLNVGHSSCVNYGIHKSFQNDENVDRDTNSVAIFWGDLNIQFSLRCAPINSIFYGDHVHRSTK